MEPRIQYTTTSNGVSIAYAVLGQGPPILSAAGVFGPLFLYSLEASTGGPSSRVPDLVDRGWQVILYDGAGCGNSERNAPDFSLEARMSELEAVVGACGLDLFALHGGGGGGMTAIAYAAQYPRRVSKLTLQNSYSRGADYGGAISTMRASRAMMRGMGPDAWEFYTLTVANAVSGFSDSELARRMAAAYRSATSLEGYLAYSDASDEIDVTPLLASVRAPTLVVHDKTSKLGDFSPLARNLAGRITGARLVSTEDVATAIDQFLREGEGATTVAAALPHGTATILFADIADSTALTEHMGDPAFRAKAGELDAALPHGTATILFADIADSTALTEQSGDAAFRAKAGELDAALRSIVRDCAGTPVDGRLVGDGLMAVFTSSHQAIACAQRGVEEGSRIGLPLHLGIHAGDVSREGNNVYGGAVNIAARVAAASAAGEIMVSDVVRTLARTSAAVTFEDRGEHSLKGVAEPQRLWAVRGRP